jgi:hypothetical protein
MTRTSSAAPRVCCPASARRPTRCAAARRGLIELIPRLQAPLLGICLGMQLLYERSEEGDAPCLGVLAGERARIPPAPGRPCRTWAGTPAQYGAPIRCSRASAPTPTTSTSCTATRRRLTRPIRSATVDYGASAVRRCRQAREFPRRAVSPRALMARRCARAAQFPGAVMLLIPSIDLRGGHACACGTAISTPRRATRIPLQLLQAIGPGRALAARRRSRRRARRLASQPARRSRELAAEAGISLQVGGGVRTRDGRRPALPRRRARRHRQRRRRITG